MNRGLMGGESDLRSRICCSSGVICGWFEGPVLSRSAKIFASGGQSQCSRRALRLPAGGDNKCVPHPTTARQLNGVPRCPQQKYLLRKLTRCQLTIARSASKPGEAGSAPGLIRYFCIAELAIPLDHVAMDLIGLRDRSRRILAEWNNSFARRADQLSSFAGQR